MIEYLLKHPEIAMWGTIFLVVLFAFSFIRKIVISIKYHKKNKEWRKFLKQGDEVEVSNNISDFPTKGVIQRIKEDGTYDVIVNVPESRIYMEFKESK